MADISNILTSVAHPSVQGGQRTGASVGASERAAYAGAGDVSRRANVLNADESPENMASLKRLDRALTSDQPLRGDVPRGFYLNIKV